MIVNQQTGRVLNPDVADQANTILKMACKRALVAAVLVATNASELFTQDVEDMAAGATVEAEAVSPPIEERQSNDLQALLRRKGSSVVKVLHRFGRDNLLDLTVAEYEETMAALAKMPDAKPAQKPAANRMATQKQLRAIDTLATHLTMTADELRGLVQEEYPAVQVIQDLTEAQAHAVLQRLTGKVDGQQNDADDAAEREAGQEG